MSQVAIIMGSKSDAALAQKAEEVLAELGLASFTRVLSAHRTPEETLDFARSAADQGVQVIIAIAGLAAALPGVLAASTQLPVIGVPKAAGPLAGQDALYAMVQMPPGVPVATVGLDNATNAAVLAARIIALHDEEVSGRLQAYVQRMRAKVLGG